MRPPPPNDQTVITIFAKKKQSNRGGTVDTGAGGEYENMNSPGNDAATPHEPGAPGESQGGFVSPERQFILGRLSIAAHDHSLDDAYAAYDAKDYAKALTLFKRSYEKIGFGQAAIMVARMYLYGLGTPRDTQQAIIWLKRDADKGRPPAIMHPYLNADYFPLGAEAAVALARIYAVGFDVPVDASQARHWYARADELGYYPATYIMGNIYRAGYGGEKSMPKAMACYTRAAKAGYGPAQYTLAEIYYTGADGVAADAKQGLSWLLASAQSGDPDGLYAVGQLYETGQGGLTADPVKALAYYKEAAVKGQPDAEEAIGLAFYTGAGLTKDMTFARKWFLKASQDANPDAMFNLAVMLINGEGGDKDYVQAWVWLKIADAGGHAQAKAALAELEPKMTPDERAKAQALFQPAAEGTKP